MPITPAPVAQQTAATVEALKLAAEKLTEAIASLEANPIPDEQAGEEFTDAHVELADLLGGVAATSLAALAMATNSAVADAYMEDQAWGVQQELLKGEAPAAIREAFPLVTFFRS